MRKLLITTALALGFSACGEPARTPAPVETPQTPAPTVELSVRDMLIDCAGAIAAQGNVDPIADPSTGSAAENVYFTVLALMDKEPGLKGPAGRAAARTSRDKWAASTVEARSARAAECTTRFGG